MSWEERARKLGQVVRQQEIERVLKEQAQQEEIKKRQKEYERVAKQLNPRVKKVCRVFASSIKGKLWEEKVKGVPPRCPPTKFVIGRVKGEYGYPEIEVEILSRRVSVSTQTYTRAFALECRYEYMGYRDDMTPLSTFYLYPPDVTRPTRLALYYDIPTNEFTEDRLATALEVLCKEALSEEARKFSEDEIRRL